eukprot:443486-Prymnesium_polylepis.1
MAGAACCTGAAGCTCTARGGAGGGGGGGAAAGSASPGRARKWAPTATTLLPATASLAASVTEPMRT